MSRGECRGESVEGRVSRGEGITQFNFVNFYIFRYMFYTPNMDNNGHDTGLGVASRWLYQFLTPLLSNGMSKEVSGRGGEEGRTLFVSCCFLVIFYLLNYL